MTLSKSDYITYLKHPAWLWLKKHDPDKLPEHDENTQAIFDAGNLFESYAEQIFGESVKLGFSFHDQSISYWSLPDRTKQAIDDGATVLLQARFEADGLTCITDVIKVVGDKTIDLYEIKASTKAKPEHIPDLAFQAHVLRACGYTIQNIAVVHINNEYVRQGDIVPEELAHITDVTEQVNAITDETSRLIQEALTVVESTEMPDLSPRLASSDAFGEWLDIYKHITQPDKYSIYSLITLNPAKISQLEDDGFKLLTDIPTDYPLSPKQHAQIDTTKRDQRIITPEPIRELLKSFEYPLYFLDYETLAGVIPPFDGTRSYQQIPFQYSVHILDNPDGELRHEEYLHRENTNPCKSVAGALRSHIGDTGTVLAWNMSFEKSCNKTLADAVPELEEFLLGLNERMNDLDIPFANLWYVDKDFFGSYSIKYVLPAVVSELSYKGLGIQNGATAQRLWMQAVIDGKDHIDKEVMFADLLEYCRLDTLAMVEIFNVLRKL